MISRLFCICGNGPKAPKTGNSVARKDLAEHAAGRRAAFAGLVHDRVAHDERGSDHAARHGDRIVPRCQHRDDAEVDVSVIAGRWLMITPRGYANKYAVEDGERNTRLGEQAGRSLSTGLTGWLEDVRTRHAAGLSLAEIARRDRLPEDYVAAVLAESADTESDVVMDSECE